MTMFRPRDVALSITRAGRPVKVRLADEGGSGMAMLVKTLPLSVV
jgi:hypothetical protein